MLCCLLLERRIVDRGRAICLVGDGAHNDERHLVEVGDLGDRCALHLGAVSVEQGLDAVLLLLRTDELLARGNAPCEALDLRSDGSDCIERSSMELRICREGHGIEPRHLSRLEAEVADVHIVVDGVGRNDDVADVDVVVERACDTGVDEMGHVVALAEGLRDHSGIDLADAALADHDIRSAELALAEVALGNLRCLRVLELGLEPVHFFCHGTDDADLDCLHGCSFTLRDS